MPQDLTFNQWFDIFCDELKVLGHTGKVDKYTFEADYEDDKTPEEAAMDFFVSNQ